MVFAFISAVPVSRSQNGYRREAVARSKVCPLIMRKDKPKASKGSKPQQQPKYESKKETMNYSSAEDMLLKDLKALRSKRKAMGKPKGSQPVVDGFKTVIDTILLWDFFLVVGLLVWLVVALIPHFAAKNDVLLDPWLGLWQPFIQPVLGVLMLGTIVQGTLSFINSKE